MKLNNLSRPVQELLNAMLALPVTHCDLGDNCMQSKINKLFEITNQAQSDAHSFIKNELKFLWSVSLVQTDGRCCPGPDKLRQLRKLTTDDWRLDVGIVTSGIRDGVIRLEQSDLNNIQGITKS